MDRYRRMAILAAVVENRSIRRAARALGLTPSAVSQQVRRLEHEAGATLLRRTTRQLALTEAGAAFYEGCAAMVEAARSAHENLAAVLDSPRGELSLGAPAGFAAAHLVPALIPLLRAHPAMRLRTVVTDERIDLVQERIDLAIAISRPLPPSSLVRHHLADWDLGLVAAPAYLARHGTPAQPEALAGHDFVTLPRWHHGLDVLTGSRRQTPPSERRAALHQQQPAPRSASSRWRAKASPSRRCPRWRRSWRRGAWCACCPGGRCPGSAWTRWWRRGGSPCACGWPSRR